MPFYKHILVAVDVSEEARIVSRKAAALARACSAKISLVHALDDIAMPDTGYGTIIPLDGQALDPPLQPARDRLLQIAAEMDIDRQNCWLVWGSPNDEIVRIAQNHQVDLIVTGSHARHGLALLLGSTANSVLHHANCDLLAVRLSDH